MGLGIGHLVDRSGMAAGMRVFRVEEQVSGIRTLVLSFKKHLHGVHEQ